MINPNVVLPTLMAIIFISAVGGLWYQQGIIGSIKTSYPELWRSLGEPHLLKNNTPTNNGLFLKFLFKDGYKEIADEELQRKCARLKIFAIAYVIFFVLAMGYFLNAIKG